MPSIIPLSIHPVRKGVWQSLLRTLAGLGGTSAGLTGGAPMVLDTLGDGISLGPVPVTVILGIVSGASVAMLGMIDKIPDTPAVECPTCGQQAVVEIPPFQQ